MKIYENQFWKVETPDDWIIQAEDDAPVVFYQDDSDWAIQLSHYLKAAENVTDDDLKDFVRDLLKHSEGKIEIVKTFNSIGLKIEYVDEENILWRHILLRSGKTMLYVTYNTDLDATQLEDYKFQAFIESLNIKSEPPPAADRG